MRTPKPGERGQKLANSRGRLLYVTCCEKAFPIDYRISPWISAYYTLEQGWPRQLYHWAIIFVPIFKRAAKLFMTNSQYFTSFSSNFFANLIFSLYTCQKHMPLQIFFVLTTKFTSLEKFFLPKKVFCP